MTIEELTANLTELGKQNDPIGATVKFDFGDAGKIYINGNGDANDVNNSDEEADCVMIMSLETFEKIRSGSMNPMMAVMMGKVKIKGDMGIAMKLQNFM